MLTLVALAILHTLCFALILHLIGVSAQDGCALAMLAGAQIAMSLSFYCNMGTTRHIPSSGLERFVVTQDTQRVQGIGLLLMNEHTLGIMNCSYLSIIPISLTLSDVFPAGEGGVAGGSYIQRTHRPICHASEL